jgi:uncharacterized protein
MKKLESFSKKLHAEKDPAHDFSHIKRIVKICKWLATSETDVELLVCAAYCHGALDKEEEIRVFLRKLNFEGNRIENILSTAKNSTSASKCRTMEEKVLYDANVLDALGAIGIVRAFIKGGYEKQTIQQTIETMKRNMKRKVFTRKAKAIARERKLFMEKFLKRLEMELRS